MRETRHLWIGNLAESIREERIVEHFKRYGKIDKVRFLPKRGGETGLCACVAFMDIRSAQKAKAAVNTIGDRELVTDYFDPSRGASSTTEEGSRHVQQSQQGHTRSSASRRYESHRTSASGGEERFNIDRPSSYDRNYQHSEAGGAEGYDSDRSRPRGGGEKHKSRSRSSNSVKQQGPTVKKQKPIDPTGKSPKKKTRKKTEDGKVKAKKVKQKSVKERGRSPTTKHKKARPADPADSLAVSASRKVGKTGSSSEGRSSSSGSATGTSSGSRRSSSASSTSSSGSTNSSKTHTSNSRSSGSSYEVEEGPEARKLVAMCVRKLPVRPTVTSLRDGIFHEFKKYGKVKSVLVRGDGADRHALVLFRTAAEANKAITHAKSKLLFGVAIEASIYDGEVSGQELEECGGIIDEFHPRASRTLFVGNLDKTVGYSDIQNIFVRFGEIVAIEIKKQHNIPQYAFLQYTDIASIVRAITKMDGERLGRNTLKLGFGKTVMSSCLWVDGITDSFTENYLASCFQRYGPVKHVVIDRNRGQALIFYAKYDFAQTAMAKMRARKLNGSRLKLDYASNELIEIFLKHMQNSGQSIQGLENIRQLLQPPTSPTSTSHQPSASSSYSRSQDSRSYYDERSQSNYSEEQFASSDGSHRRVWRGRSRERYPEQSSHSRQKRGYEDAYDRTEYHRDASWEHDGYAEGSRRTSHYDQDYRQREYDVRREQRGYSRKTSRNTAHEESYHYRSSRDRPREERDLDRSRDRMSESFYPPRSGHSSPSHPRYLSRRSRSLSPAPRDSERFSMERNMGDPPYRRRGRSGSRSPDIHLDSVRRRNSMESKSSSHSGSRYTSRTGDVDMREYLDEGKLSVASPRGDERIVEFSESAKKLRVRKRVTANSPLEVVDPPPRAQRNTERRSETDKPEPMTPGNKSSWQSESPARSDNTSCNGTPTRDENDDLIGEVIIKHPSKSSATSEKSRSRDRDGKSQYSESRKDRSKQQDKDYRKGFTSLADTGKLDSGSKTKPVRSSSASLIQRVHSPSDAERKSNSMYTKDFDYRKHAVVRSSKSSIDSTSRHRSTKSTVYRRGDEQKRGRGHYDDTVSNSPHSASPSSERQRGPAGTSSLLKREYSPRLEDEKSLPAKASKSSERSLSDSERQRHTKERSRAARHSKDDDSGDTDKRRQHSQKRKHSSEEVDDEEAGAKRERKSSSSHHHQPHQKHEAPMSIASQMFLQEEEESGMESPAVSQVLKENQDSKEEASTSKWEVQDEEVPATDEQSPTDDFSISTVVAAQSLLPKRLPKPPSPKPETKKQDGETLQVKKESNDGNLTELEKEKARIQKLLSKLDSEKQLDVKDAEEVAGVVLQELTIKARSKLLATMPVGKEKPPAKETVGDADQSPKPSDTSEVVVETVDVVEQDGYPGCGDVSFEEEIVVDTIEEVTEEEVIETEVVEVETTMKEEEKGSDEKLEVVVSEETPVLVEIPAPIVPPLPKVQKIDHTQGCRKQMEARRKEMEKLEKRKDHENKKLLRRQEKEKKNQMKLVSAMRGPSQSVISSVDEEDKDCVSDEEGNAPVEDVTTPSEQEQKISPETTENVEAVEQLEDAPSKVVEENQVEEAKNGVESSAKEDEQTEALLEAVVTNIQPTDQVQDAETENCNMDLEKPWPPDRGKLSPDESKTPVLNEARNAVLDSERHPLDEIELVASKPSSVKTASPITPSSAEHSTPMVITPHAPTKDPSPKSMGQGVTPTGSLSSSVSHKSSAATPTSVTPSQTTRTPGFTTPSPASTSSTSSSKSQPKLHIKNSSSAHLHHKHHGQSTTHQQKRPSHQGRPDHHAMPRGSNSSGSDHRRRLSTGQQQLHRSYSSSGHGAKARPEGQKKSFALPSKRVMATITVGLDASPSKPLGKSELERLKAELECVRNQLDMDMSPSSLSPCSDDETTVGKSPAQLLSPVSPVLRSPADSMSGKRSETQSPAPQSTGASSLTDRLKLLGRIKKKTPGVVPAVKAETTTISAVKQNEATNLRKSRILRSSIFDQDAERLSHICQLAERSGNKPDEEQKLKSLQAVVPLFSGSKFLESGPFPIPNEPVVAPTSTVPLAAVPATPVACNASLVGPATSDQHQLSSISGPKNVLSLSSSNLPETAERRYDFAGKNCNININTINHNRENLASTSAHHRHESSNVLSLSTERATSDDNTVLPPAVVSEPSGVILSKNRKPPQPELPVSKSASVDTPPSMDVNNPAAAFDSPNSDLKADNGPLQILKKPSSTVSYEAVVPGSEQNDVKPVSEIDARQTLDDEKIFPTDEIGIYQSSVDSAPRDYLEEVVCDMDVYAGSCMEVEEVPSEEVGVAETVEDMITSGLEINMKGCEVEPPNIEQKISVEDGAHFKINNPSVDAPADISCDPLVKEKPEEMQIPKDNQDSEKDQHKVDKLELVETELKTGESGLPTAIEPEKRDFEAAMANPTSSESKAKASDKGIKKLAEKQEISKDSKKHKPSGKHKSAQKDAKPGSKPSSLKKDSVKKLKHDDSRVKTSDSKLSSKDIKSVPDKEIGRIKSTSEKSSSMRVASTALEKSDDDTEKLNLDSEQVEASDVVLSDKKDAKPPKVARPEVKKPSQKNTEREDSSSTGKVKDKELIKGKKVLKEGKKEKKLLERKPDFMESKSDVKKLKKKEKRNGSPSRSMAKSEKITEHVEKDSASGLNKETEKQTSKEEQKTKGVSVSQDAGKTLRQFTKSDSKDGGIGLGHGKKRKKKHTSEKEKGKSDKIVEAKDHKKEPMTQAPDVKRSEKEKDAEFGEKVKKPFKIHPDKPKTSETKSSSLLSKDLSQSKPKKEGRKEESSVKSGKKDFPRKSLKGHTDLKASHSVPGKMAAKKEEGCISSKKDAKKKLLCKKVEKASSASPASKKSRYSMIYSTDSDSFSGNEDDTPRSPPSKKKKMSAKQMTSDAPSKSKNEKTDRAVPSPALWSDFEDGAETASVRRYLSSSSSSSFDSTIPPPVVESSLLVTETIKSETILPPGYYEAGGFTDSSEGQDDHVMKQDEKKSSKRLEEMSERRKKKFVPKGDLGGFMDSSDDDLGVKTSGKESSKEEKTKKKSTSKPQDSRRFADSLEDEFGLKSDGKKPLKVSGQMKEEDKKKPITFKQRNLEGFTDSSDDQDGYDVKIDGKKSSKILGEAKDGKKKMKKKKLVPKSRESAKWLKSDKKRKGDGKVSERRLILSSSGVDSSDEDLAITTSSADTSASSEDSDVLTKHKTGRQASIVKPKERQKKSKINEGPYGFEPPLSDSEAVDSKLLQKEELETRAEKADKRKGFSTKISAQGKKIGSGQSMKLKFDSSDDASSPVRDKKRKKKMKTDRESTKEKKTSEHLDAKSKTVEEKSKSYEKLSKKTEAKDKSKSDSDKSPNSDADTSEKISAKVIKPKDSQSTSKKNLPSKSKEIPDLGGNKSILEKSKSDSKVLKASSQKLSEKKDKLKAKWRSEETACSSQTKKAKDSSSKHADMKLLTETVQHLKPEEKRSSSSRDKARGDKDSVIEDRVKDMSKMSSSKKDLTHKPSYSKDSSVSVSEASDKELKPSLKESSDVVAQKHHKKHTKEVKKSSKKLSVSTMPSKTQPDKEKIKSSDMKPQESSSKQDGQKHDKKRKLKKAHKKGKRETDKLEMRQKEQEKSARKEQDVPPPSPPKAAVVEKKNETPCSMFNSDTDDNDFELVEEASIGILSTKTQKFLQSEPSKSPKVLKIEKLGSDAFFGGKNTDEPYSGSLHEPKSPSIPWGPHLSESSGLKGGNKRRTSAESTISTTDESDIEQKLAVESAIVSIVDDTKQVTNSPPSVKQELQTKPSEEANVCKIMEVKENVETKASDSNRSSMATLSEKPDLSQTQQKKKIKVEPGISTNPKVPRVGYQRPKHGLRYGAKERRDRMDKMKSVSHERDEEAVRSIMGLLDESSDADSYFSDVRPDDGASSSTLGGSRNSDTERPKRTSRDSDSASVGFGRLVETTVEEAGNFEANESTEMQVKGEEQSEATEARSTAEENELAAAVSSIEGISCDFDSKPSMYDTGFPAAASTASFSDHRFEDKPQQKDRIPSQETDAPSQEEVEKGSKEAALAASTLLAESSEEDSTFFGFRSKKESSASSQTKGLGISQSSLDIELPSIKTDVAHSSPKQTQIAPLFGTTAPSSQSSVSMKRPRHSRDCGSPPQPAGADSKSEVSASDASESESPLIEPGKMNLGHMPAKQRKVRKIASSGMEQSNRNIQTDSSENSSSSISFVKPETVEATPPFVCTSTASHPTQPSATSAATPFVNVSTLPTPAASSIKPPSAAPTQQRKTSRDSDPGGGTKRRSSSSSAISPTCGSLLPQLTTLAAPSTLSSFSGGTQTPGSSIYPSGNSPFLSRPTPHTSQKLCQSNFPMDMHSVSQSMMQVPTSVAPPSNSYPNTHHPQGYPSHLLPQPSTYSVRPVTPSERYSYAPHPQPFFSGAAPSQSMSGHTNLKMPMQSAGMPQLPSKSNTSVPFQTSNSSASLTSSTSYQSQFSHQIIQSAAAHKSQDPIQPPAQYHVRVPTYPHQHVPPQHQQPMAKPEQQQLSQRAQAPTATQPEPMQKTVLRPAFSRPQMVPHPGYSPARTYSIPGQVLPQSPYGLPSANLPQSASFSPTTTMMPSAVPQTQEKFRPRPPSSAYLGQAQSALPVVPASPAPRPAAPTQPKSSETQQTPPQSQTAAGKTEMQRPPLSSAPSSAIPGLPQASTQPQPMYRKMDPTQPHLLGAQPVVPPQQVFAPHHMYYPPGMHGIPALTPGLSGYLPRLYGIRPGMSAAPVTMVHPSASIPEMPRHVQQRLHMPQTVGRKEQASSPTTTKASPTVRDAPHPIHPPFGMPQAVSQPMTQMQPQAYGTAALTSIAPSHPHRYHHGDRVVRVPSEQEQLKMVDQHFKRSGIATGPPRNHPPSVPSTTEKSQYTPPAKQATLVTPSLPHHPGMYPHNVRMMYPTQLNMPPVVRFGPEQHMWSHPEGNLRPPPPTAANQTLAYTSVPSPTHPTLHASTLQPQSRTPATAQSKPQIASPHVAPSAPKHDDQVLDLFQRYPVVWQGLLAIKNDSAAVQTHFICGDRTLAQTYLPLPDAQGETDKDRDLAILRIVQRMRIEPHQLGMIDKKITESSEFCVLLALPCGRDEPDVIRQQNALRHGFIEYLMQKHAAGIVNIQRQQTQSEQQYVLHVFPPCDFTTKHLERHARDLLSNINDIQHMMIVIATV